MMRKTCAALVIFAIFILGCVQPSTSSTSGSKGKDAGIAIQGFSFSSADITDAEKAAASFTVANIGSKTISGDIYVWFYGPFLGTNAWSIDPAGSVDMSSGGAVIAGETFYPPVPEKKIPGSAKKFDILLQPPDIPAGTGQEYVFYSEICYPYSTSAFAEILSVSQNEFSVQEKKDVSQAQTANTLGPLKLTLVSRKSIRTNTKIPIVFKIDDTAGGYATKSDETCTLDIDYTSRDKATVSVLVDGSTSGIDCGEGNNVATVDIVNKKGIVFCSVELTAASVPKRTLTISAIAEYNYYSRKSAKIRVDDAFSI